MGLCQAAMYMVMYWGIARFEEIADLFIRQVKKKGASFMLLIQKRKTSKVFKLQRCVVHPNSREYLGIFC